MGSVTSKIPKEFKILSASDRVEYIQNLWDFIADSPDQVPVPDSHKQVLDQRLAIHNTEPSLAEPWGQVRDKIRKNLSKT